MEWRMFCETRNRVPLLFAGEIDEASVGKSTIMMTADADKDQEAGGFPVRAAKYEMWSGSIDPDMVKAIMASRSLHVRRTTPMPDEKVDVAKFDIDLTGLASMRTQLAAACSSVDAKPKGPWPASPWPATPLPNVTAPPSAVPSP
jgi:hypothetical protein